MKKILFCLFLSALLLPTIVFAKADLSFSSDGLSFSESNPLENQQIRIYARVLNDGDVDMTGYVKFLANGKQISDEQPISVRTNTYDDVFVDYTFKAGTYKVEAYIQKVFPTDENTDNNLISKTDFFVDLDTDEDKVGDSVDTDDDNDGLTDEQETSLGTNPKMSDTDGDEINDKIDVFPLDKNEYIDTDGDGIGDSQDQDIDNDGILNEDEKTKYGTSPFLADTDSDGLTDQEEVETTKTSPILADTDHDGVSDIEDEYPLDASKWQAGLLGSITGYFKGQEYLYFILGAFTLLVLWLLFRRKKRR